MIFITKPHTSSMDMVNAYVRGWVATASAVFYTFDTHDILYQAAIY